MRYLLVLTMLFLLSCNDQKSIDSTGLTKVKLQLNWMPEAEHGGYYEALLKGYFKEEGLDVEIIPGGPGVRVETETALQRTQFGIANADKILIVRGKEMKLTAILAPFENSPRCLIFHKDLGVKSFNDLTKAKVLILNNTKPFYHWLIKKYPELKNKDTIPYNKATFMSGKDAVIQGYINSEPLIFKDKGLDVNFLKVSDTEFNPYTSVLMCSDDYKKANPQIVEKIKKASVKGWLSYLKNPSVTNDHIEKINPANKGTLDKSTEMMMELMSPQNEQFGQMTVERWKSLAGQLKEINLLDKIPEDIELFID